MNVLTSVTSLRPLACRHLNFLCTDLKYIATIIFTKLFSAKNVDTGIQNNSPSRPWALNFGLGPKVLRENAIYLILDIHVSPVWAPKLQWLVFLSEISLIFIFDKTFLAEMSLKEFTKTVYAELTMVK